MKRTMINLHITVAAVGLVVASLVGAAVGGATCVWNQAYEESGKMDSVSDIMNSARGCYVLVDTDEIGNAKTAVAGIKKANNRVGCYMSVGTLENWRKDVKALSSSEFKEIAVSKQWAEWKGEFFVWNVDKAVPFMKKRIDKIAQAGCDFVEFDNMDYFDDDDIRKQFSSSSTPFPSRSEGTKYVSTLCSHARSRGVKCMAKSAGKSLGFNFDGMTVESYRGDSDWWVSNDIKQMLGSGKLGIIVHYGEKSEGACAAQLKKFQAKYGNSISFICSDNKGYNHYN